MFISKFLVRVEGGCLTPIDDTTTMRMLFHYVLICVILAGLATAHDLVLVLQTKSDDALDIGSGFTIFQRSCLDQKRLFNPMVDRTMDTCNREPRTKPMRDDYNLTAGIGWHKLHTRPTLWNMARKTCIEEGGHLAIVNSIAEATVLGDMLKRSSSMITGSRDNNQAFVGIHNYFAAGEWVTVHGDSLATAGFFSWIQGQPDNSGGSENCGTVALNKDGFNDIDCKSSLAFFCEIPLTHVSLESRAKCNTYPEV